MRWSIPFDCTNFQEQRTLTRRRAASAVQSKGIFCVKELLARVAWGSPRRSSEASMKKKMLLSFEAKLRPYKIDIMLECQGWAAATVAAVHTRCVAGVPCILCSARQAKEVLTLVRLSGWHPNHHSRLVLDRRPGKHATSWRAYQVSDVTAVALARRGVSSKKRDRRDSSSAADEAAALLLVMIDSGAVHWCPSFMLHEYIIDPDRCDRPLLLSVDGCGGDHGAEAATIRYLPGHALKPELTGLPAPVPALPSAAAAAQQAAADFSLARRIGRRRTSAPNQLRELLRKRHTRDGDRIENVFTRFIA